MCGQTELVKLFTIENVHNGAQLFPIGSVCVNRFELTDMNRGLEVFEGLLKLRSALLAGEHIGLDSDYFTRAMIIHLHAEGAFTPDRWNGGDGQRDCDFLLKMFNKRNKSEISARQRYKITTVLKQKVFPFVLTYDRLG